jgi:hypothetical protein
MAVSYQELAIKFLYWWPAAKPLLKKMTMKATVWGFVRVPADWSIAGQRAANQSPNWSSITPSQI